MEFPIIFIRHRELLGDLARLAYETIKELMIEAVADDKARPGVVAVPQSFGSVLNPHPHTHSLGNTAYITLEPTPRERGFTGKK